VRLKFNLNLASNGFKIFYICKTICTKTRLNHQDIPVIVSVFKMM